MKKILLVSNYVFHYRQKLYNYFADEFNKEGYDFYVMSDEFQDVPFPIRFHKEICKKGILNNLSAINRIKPDVVIVFLHLKDKEQLPIIYYCRAKRIPVIFWNKGVSDSDPNNKWKNVLYHHIHNLCDALITYTPDTKKYFDPKNYNKLFIGNNTVDNSDIDKSKYNKEMIKKKYSISEEKVILYISRMKATKRIDILLDSMANEQNVAVVAMGAGITDEIRQKFETAPNLYYLGQKYGEEGNEVWAMGDVFCIPLNTGLGINDAIFWNLPIVTMNGLQPPEICYLKNGINGFIVNSKEELKERLLQILSNDALLTKMKHACQDIYEKEVDVKVMFRGFHDAIKFIMNGK